MSPPVNSCSRSTSCLSTVLLMLMVLGVIRIGNGHSYATLIIGLQSGSVLASFPSLISSSVSSTFTLPTGVQLAPSSSASGGAAGATSPSLGSSSGASSSSSSSSLSPSSSLPSSSLSSPSTSLSSSSSSSSSSLPSSFVQPNTPSPPCDFDTYETTGCEDDEGSYCDTSTQKCTCKDDHPIRLLGYCLKIKSIGQECYTSAQCKSINNAACYIFGKEYDNERISGGHNVGRQVSNWPTGNCRCNLGHQWDNATESCIKKTIGSWCNDDWDCIKEKYNTQCSRPQNLCECAWGFFYDAKSDSCQTPKLWGQKCISNVDCEAENFICSSTTFKCVCPNGFHFDPIHPGCKINADSSCDRGYRWDEDWGRCIPVRSAASAFPFNSLTGVNILGRGSKSSSTSLDRTTSATGSTGGSGSGSNSGSGSGGSTASGGGDHSGSSVHSSKPDSNSETGSSSVTTALILILPNVIALALILRYCYYRKREEDSSDLTDDLERGNFAIRSAHLHNLTKFCAYPPYTTRTILPGGSIKSHPHGTCLGTTVIGYGGPGDLALGTCCVAANVTATGKVVHGKSTLESVEETDEPLGSLNQESPEGEIANCPTVNNGSTSPNGSSGPVDAVVNCVNFNEQDKSSIVNCTLATSCTASSTTESKLQLEEQTSKKKNDSTIDPEDVTFSSSSSSTRAPVNITTSAPSDCDSVTLGQRINSPPGCSTAAVNSVTSVTSGNIITTTTTTSGSSSPISPSSTMAAKSIVITSSTSDDKQNTRQTVDLATPESTGPSVKGTTTSTSSSVIHCTSTSPKVTTLVKYSPTSSGKKVDLQVLVKGGGGGGGGEEKESRALNVLDSMSNLPLSSIHSSSTGGGGSSASGLTGGCGGGIDRQSSHFILKETSSDGSCLFTSSSASAPAGGSKSSPVTSSSPAMSPCTRKHSTSTDDELPVQGANST